MGYSTRQKVILGELFETSRRPLTAREICRQAKRRVPSLGLATVYRTLRQFVAEGLIRVVEIPGAPPHYESAALHHHHFFLCQACKQVFDLVGCVRGLTSLVPDGFSVQQHEIVLYGRCSECLTQSTRSGQR
jgi:Fur family transcriptional regulator, ferric uptake regulator